MNLISLIVFAPVNGLRAYKYPSMQLVNDDSYGLSDSVLSLALGGSALVVKKISNVDGEPTLRLSVHKQVYETGMSRSGHSFGAALDISGNMPTIDSALTVLIGVLDLLEDKCVNSNSFCDKSTFENLLSVLQPVLTRALQDLKDTGKKIFPDLSKNLDARSSYFYSLKEDMLSNESVELVTWCANSIGGMLCKCLILFRTGMAQPGPLIEGLPSVIDMSRLGTDLLIKEYQEANSQLVTHVEKISELDKEILQLRASASGVQADPSFDSLISQIKLAVRDEVKAAFTRSSIKTPSPLKKQPSSSFLFQMKVIVPLSIVISALAGAAVSYFFIS
jgi:hypothetical protein